MIPFLRNWQKHNLRKKIAQAIASKPEPAPEANLEFVGILFRVESLNSVKEVKTFIQTLEAQDLRVIFLAYFPRRVESSVDYGYLHYSQEDVGWSGVPQSKHIIQFMRRRFSCVLNLDRSDDLAMHYLSSRISARFKLSLSPSYDTLYDISLAPSKEASFAETLAETLDIFTRTYLKQ